MITTGIIAIVFYITAWAALAMRWRASVIQSTPPGYTQHYLWAWLLAAGFHAVYLYASLLDTQTISLGLISAASHVMWLAGQILLISAITHKLDSLNLFTIPFIGFALFLQLIAPTDNETKLVLISGLGVHIFSALMAYSMLMIASIQGMLLAYQHNHLHSKRPNTFLRALPALQDMDHLLFRFISVGLALLSVALITGFIYLENLFGQHVAHKTILSIVAWLVFSALLVGRWRFGWRGISASRWTLSGFAILMLAFFGTKFIQEYLLAP